MRNIIVVSGPIAVGKSSFITELESRFRAVRISTREIIQTLQAVRTERISLQEAGEDLDRSTDGRWIAESLKQRVKEFNKDDIVVVDSARIARQIDHLREMFGEKVYHVHLHATDQVLKERFERRRKEQGDVAVQDPPTYEEARHNATEAAIGSLKDIADKIVDTDRLDTGTAVTLAVEQLALLPTAVAANVDIVVGGQYGSEGKGNICDFLAREYEVLVRVGGPNAGHKVKDPKYDYVHMPSGTGGNPDAKILIGAGATLDIVRVLKEIVDLGLSTTRLSIDPQAIVIEQSDCDLEAELAKAIGSTKKGVGVATARKIVGRGGEALLGARVRLVRDVPELKPYMRSVTAELEAAYAAGSRILLEGTQGTDLSIHHGLYPSVTSRETTASGCLADAGISPRRVRRIYMVTRTYPIRVGGESGEMGIELDYETIADRCGLAADEIRATEIGTVSGKPRRIGEFSLERVRRAAQLNGATDIVLTFADYIDSSNRNARTFDELTSKTKKMIAEIERLTHTSVTIIAVGFGRDKIIDRRPNN